jgi:hypothetical protein
MERYDGENEGDDGLEGGSVAVGFSNIPYNFNLVLRGKQGGRHVSHTCPKRV